MRKTLFLALLAGLFFVFDAAAQETRMVGLRGGINFSNVVAEQPTEFRQGAAGGVFAAFERGALPVPVQIDLLYTEKGFDELWPQDDEVVPYRASYLESHLAGMLPMDLPGVFELHLLGGIAPAWLLSEEVTLPEDLADEPPAYFEDVFREFDFGLVAGGNLEAGLPRATLLLDVRYVYGLTDNISFERPTFANRSLSVSLGVGYRL